MAEWTPERTAALKRALETLANDALMLIFCPKCDPTLPVAPTQGHHTQCPRVAAREALDLLAAYEAQQQELDELRSAFWKPRWSDDPS